MVGTFSAVAFVCATDGVTPTSTTAAADKNRRVSIFITPPASGCLGVRVESIPDSVDIQGFEGRRDDRRFLEDVADALNFELLEYEARRDHGYRGRRARAI